eukprot:scaffold7703_cov185-Amphora_coffeaeformis.AAC.2
MSFSSNYIYAVTGAGSGIGKSIGESLASRGARVFALDICFDEEAYDLERITRHICDVSVEASVTGAFAKLQQIIQSSKDGLVLKGLVNCAGIVLEKPLTETTVEDMDRVLGVNLKGPILCAKAAVLHVQSTADDTDATATPRLKIVNIASELAHLGREKYSLYCGTKGGIISLTRSWARELAPHGILVNAVAPGPTDTPMLQSETNYLAWKETAEGIPLGRIGQPQDIASVVCLLLLPSEANFMTGSVVDVNGGAAMY